MTEAAFTIEILESGNLLTGPWRKPAQMLHAQVYDSHASIHDDATAQKLGFQGGTIEGPTHFSQFAPLCVSLWGQSWFETGLPGSSAAPSDSTAPRHLCLASFDRKHRRGQASAAAP